MAEYKDWKAKQAAFHAVNKNFKDDLNDKEIEYSDDIVEDVLRHFTEVVDTWIYPAKSYVVAICYAKWLEQDYGEDFYEVLDDPDLLFGNDPYFVPYSEDETVYNAILTDLEFKEDLGMVPDIFEYYREEMWYGS
jgi:hypothetical protein|tara:strand:- start:3068 stop:3472 length:405 start_codon:yes stop_codon:yes gene_type:complete